MSLSGVEVHPDAIAAFTSFKAAKSDIAFVTYKVEEQFVVIDEVVKKADLEAILPEAKGLFPREKQEPDDYYCLRYNLLKGLKPPRYATIMVNHYEDLQGSEKCKVLFLTWCPNDAPVKERMLISSTKEALKKKLDGLQYVVQANDDDEVSFVEVVSAGSKGKAIYK